MLEREVDQKICRHAAKKKIKAYKMTSFGSMGQSGWPDRMFLKAGKVIFMEMKRPGQTSSPRQRLIQQELANEGFAVYADIDDPAVGMAILDKEFP